MQAHLSAFPKVFPYYYWKASSAWGKRQEKKVSHKLREVASRYVIKINTTQVQVIGSRDEETYSTGKQNNTPYYTLGYI